nr:MAG TPA: hypothetical protein [Caudoviricetes sp.]
MTPNSTVSRARSSVRWMVVFIFSFLPGQLGCSIGIRMLPGLGWRKTPR